MQKSIKIAVQGATSVPMEELVPFQGELKTLPREEYEKLRKNLIDNGFSFTIHVWQNEGKNYIIDGHQRLTALKMMKETEEWEVPALPISIVQADDFASAKRKILAGVSQYGHYTAQSLADFIKQNDIPFDATMATFSFPEIDMDKFAAMFSNQPVVELPKVESGETAGETQIKSGSEGVKQVQLFFNSEDHADFMDMVNRLTAVYETENITDTVLGALREAIKAYNSH